MQKTSSFSRHLYTNCPICSSADIYVVGSKKGEHVVEDFSVARCRACSSAFVKDPIHPRHLDEIYCGEYFTGSGLDESVNYVENLRRQDWFFEKYDWTIGAELTSLNIPQGAKWLDLGCGLGNVLDWAKDRYRAETYGTDISAFARDTVSARGHQIIGATADDLLNNPKYFSYFDVVTCYEVLEHLYEPNAFFEALSKVLKPNGKFHFTTGHPPRDDSKLVGWSYIRPEVHILFYSRQGIKHLFDKHQIRAVPRVPARPAHAPKAYSLPAYERSPKAKIRDLLWNLNPSLYTRYRHIHPAGIKI